MFKSPDSVWSGRTCPANLGVLSCPVRKLICPVLSSPSSYELQHSHFAILLCQVPQGINMAGSVKPAKISKEPSRVEPARVKENLPI